MRRLILLWSPLMQLAAGTFRKQRNKQNNKKTNKKQWGQKIRSLCRLLQGRFQKQKTNNTLDMVDFLLLLTSEILKRNIMTNVKSKLLYNGESFWWKQCNERQLLMKAKMQYKCCCSATAATAWSIICCLSVFGLFVFLMVVLKWSCSQTAPAWSIIGYFTTGRAGIGQ